MTTIRQQLTRRLLLATGMLIAAGSVGFIFVPVPRSRPNSTLHSVPRPKRSPA